MSDEPVTFARKGGVATITLNRPDARNRLDAAGMSALAAQLDRAATDPDVRVVVLTGTGTTFCAGADLSAAVTGGAEGFAGSGPDALVRVLTAMLEHPKPIIARVQGHVAGGGNGLVAAADIAVGVADARFAFGEVRLGVAPAVISVVCLQVMDRRSAQELLLTGERVDAARARSAGLLTAVVENGELDAEVARYAQALMCGGPEALTQTRLLLREVPGRAASDAFTMTAAMSARLFASAEAREGMTAFLEKRPAAWAPSD